MNIDEFTQQYNIGRRDFRFENLAKIDLAWRQDLIDCNFEGCDLNHANLAAVNFSNSNFQDANLEFANLSGANLSQTNLQGTNLEGANLSQTKLHGVQYNDSTEFPQGITPEFIQTQVKIPSNPPPHPLKSESMKSASALPRKVDPFPTEIQAQNQDAEKALEEARQIHQEANRLKKEAETAKAKALQDLKIAQQKAKQAKDINTSNHATSRFSKLRASVENISHLAPEKLLGQVQGGVELTVQQIKKTAQNILEPQSTLPPPFPHESSALTILSPNGQGHELELPPPLPSALANSPSADEIPPHALVVHEPSPLLTASSPILTDSESLNWNILSTFKAKNPVKLSISPDSQLLAMGQTDSTLRLWTINSSTPKFVYMFFGQQQGIFAIAFSPNQKLIASGAGDGKVTIWDISSKRLHQTLGLSSYVADAASHNQKLFQIFNPSLLVMSTAIAVSAIAFSPKGDRLVVGYADGTLRNWDVNSARILKETKIHSAPITQIKFSQNGKLMLTASMDQSVKVMIPERWNLCHSYHYEAAWPSDCVITPDHELVIAGLSNGNIQAWNLAHKTVQYDMKSSHNPGLMNLYLHPADSTLMSVSQDPQIKLWKVKTGEQLGTLSGSYPSCLSPNHKLLATTNNKAEIQLFKKIT
jgi:WD40 repeat protein/uncharacterized protein YjbI with pentapeptide repeats